MIRLSRFLVPLFAVAVAMGCDSAGDSMSDPPPSPTNGWRRVEGVPATFMEVLHGHDGALYVGGEDRLYTSVAGDRWTESAAIPGGYEVASITTTAGRLFVGTYQGGVFESTDGAMQWTERNEGLSGRSTRTVRGMAVRGSMLYAGTAGASVFRRPLREADAEWHPFRTGIPSNIAWDASALAVAGDRLVVGSNGFVFVNATEAGGWREATYDSGLGTTFLQVHDLLDTGSSLLGGGAQFLYRSTDGGESWTATQPLNQGSVDQVRFAATATVVISMVRKGGTVRLYVSTDDGRTWQQVDEQMGVQAFDAAVYRDDLYLARVDGLWSISIEELLARTSEATGRPV